MNNTMQAYNFINPVAPTAPRPSPLETSCADQSACPLFRLPTELRNRIYNLAFATPPSVDFADATPPSKALVQTCRRIHSETSKMHKAAFKDFWAETEFTIDMHGQCAAFFGGRSMASKCELDTVLRDKVYQKIAGMEEQDLKHIKKLHICSGEYARTVTLKHGFWIFWLPEPDRPLRRSIMLLFPREDDRVLWAAGFQPHSLASTRLYSALAVHSLRREDVRRGRKIISRQGLSREEIMAAVRWVCRHDVLFG